MQDIIYLIIIAGLAAAVFLLWRSSQKQPSGGGQEIIMLQGQIQELRQTVDEKLGDSTAMFQQQYSESAKLIVAVTEELTRVSEGQKQVMNVTDQLKNLQDILKNPKQRGVLGEYYLEALLKNVMPPGSYQMQYGFPNGTIVDAAVFIKDKVIPIDSKFSLENYNRITESIDQAEKERFEKAFISDLKNRIQETSKYIQPEQGTTDFAFMFIPHEAIYYDLLVNKIGAVTEETENLVQRAAGKYKVIIVSPTSFLAYLQTVLQGLKAMQIEESAKQIIKRVEDLGRHLRVYEDYHNKLGNSLTTTVNSFNASRKELGKIDKDVLRIAGESPGLAPMELLKPEHED
jgi:DNA recombination protein RmuC